MSLKTASMRKTTFCLAEHANPAALFPARITFTADQAGATSEMQ
jgi:hypothetical protein